MPSGVSKINHILSKGTFGRNQQERNLFIQNLADIAGDQLENDILTSLNTAPPNTKTFSQNSGSTKNTGGSSTTTGSARSSTTTVQTIGPQVVFQQSATKTNSASGSSAATTATGSISNGTATTGSNQSAINASATFGNTSFVDSGKTFADTQIRLLVQELFKIGGPTVNDPIKSIKGYYYVIQKNKLQFFKPNDIVSKLFDLSFLKDRKTKEKNPFSSKILNKNGLTSTEESYNITFNIPIIKQIIRNFFPKIYSNTRLQIKFTDIMVSEIIAYINRTVVNKIYDDYSFSYQAPFDVKKIKDSNLGNSLIFNVQSEYNFYSDPYEQITQINPINERVYPNLYIYNSTEVQEQKASFKLNHATLNKRIKLKDIDDEYYYTNWSNAIANINDIKKLDSLSIPLLNTVYQKKDFITLQDKNIDRELFPMHALIEFSMTNADMNIVEELNNGIFTIPLYNSVCSIIPQASTIETISGFFDAAQANNPNVTDDVILLENNLRIIERQGLNDTLISDYSQKNLKVISFDLFEQISSSVENVSNYSIPKRKGFNTLNYISDTNPIDDSPIFRLIEPLKIKGKIKNIVENYSRTYKDFIKNTDLVDSETMFYRISKFRVLNVNSNTIKQYVQSYTVPNFQDVTKFIQYDTQLKYNVNYEYMVTAYQIVVGSEYQYLNSSPNKSSIKLNAVSCPVLKLVETPYFIKTIYVKDSPPIEPDIKMVFFKDISNAVKFMFNSQVSTKYAKPIIINDSDAKIFEDIKKAQETKDLVKFESEDPPKYFEIFKLDKKPTKYFDFVDAINYKVLPKFKSYSGDFVDAIEPNKKYYYIFRVADIHEHISNPTSCVEIEIVDDNGKIYPIVNIINIEEEKQENKTKSLKRFMHIKPSYVQKQSKLRDAENTQSALNNEFILGSESDSLWGKKMKVRVKSRLSNKIIDFNIYFDKQHIISKDEKDLTS